MGTGGSKSDKNRQAKLTKKQMKVILNQQSKSLCQITTNDGKKTGFLCNIPNPVLITNNHILNESQIKPGNEINIEFTDENGKKNNKKIKIDDKRTIYTIGQLKGEDIDTTIIELKPVEDNLNGLEFIEIATDLMNDGAENLYEEKYVYQIYYENGEEVITTGIIYKKDKKDKSSTLFHNLTTDEDSSGSPIILYDYKVIGLNRKKEADEKFNTATLLQFPIKEYLNIYKNKIENGKAKNVNIELTEDIVDDVIEDIDITMVYLLNKEGNEEKDGIQILGKDFVKNNKQNCKMIINKKEYDICDYIRYNDYGINKKDNSLTITLKGINRCIDASCLFFGCNSLQSLPDISEWNTRRVTNMNDIFFGCSSLESLPDISKWNTKNVTSMNDVFFGCSTLQSLPDISKWDTSKVRNMKNMFSYCSSLKSLPDISKWNTRRVVNKGGIFFGCNSLQSTPNI